MASSTICRCGTCDPSWFSQGWQCTYQKSVQEMPTLGVTRKGDRIHVTVPQSAIVSLFGRRGATLKWLQADMNCKMHVNDQPGANGQSRPSSSVEIRSTAAKPAERERSLDLCVRVMQYLCQYQDAPDTERLKDALATVQAEMKVENEARKEAESKAYEEQVLRQAMLAVGDSFSETAVHDALSKEEWDPDRAQERLFRERAGMPADMNAQGLLEASRLANALRKSQETGSHRQQVLETCSDDDGASSSVSTDVSQGETLKPVPAHIQAIRDVCAKCVAKGEAISAKAKSNKMKREFQKA